MRIKTALTTLLFCVALGKSIAFIELLTAAYPGPWLGGTRAEWLSWHLTALAYAVNIALYGAITSLSLRVLLPRAFPAYRALLANAAVAAIFGVTIASAAGKSGAALLIVLVVLPFANFAFVAWQSTRGYMSPIKAVLVLLASLASGVIAVRSGGSLQYLLRDTSAWVSAIAACSAVFTLVVGTIVLRGRTRPGWRRAGRAMSVVGCTLLIPVLLTVWPHALPQRQTLGNQPNVLLITADAMRADYCSVYGGQVPTPNLTALAKRGTRFNMCYSAAPWTVPSLCALFSAKYPPGLTPGADIFQREHEQMSYRELASYWLEPDATGSISQFKKLGYETAAFAGNGAIADQQWLLNQFDHAVVANVLDAFGATPLALNPLAERCVQSLFPDALKIQPKDMTAEARHFAKVFLRAHSSRPFFLWVHFLDPHSPYNPPARFRNGVAPTEGSYAADIESHAPGDAMTPEQARALYGGEIQYVDEGVGEILDTLKLLGLAENTVVCFTSDHGEELWDRGEIGHGHSMYNEVVHVPLIFAGPEINPGVVTTPVSSINIMPTLLSMLDRTLPSSWQGQSMQMALRGEPCPALDAPCFVQATHEFVPRTEPKQMVRDGQYKYVRWLTTGNRLLFDETQDTLEKTNLVDALPDVAARLDDELNRWEESFPADFTAATQARPYRTVKLSPPEPELREHLHALGYL